MSISPDEIYAITDNADGSFTLAIDTVNNYIQANDVTSVVIRGESVLILEASGKVWRIYDWSNETNLGAVSAADLADKINDIVVANAGGTGGGGLTYKGTWDADTNTPTLASGVGEAGDYYIVSVAGSTNLDGITDWEVSDWAIFNGTTWQKIDNSEQANEGRVKINGHGDGVSPSLVKPAYSLTANIDQVIDYTANGLFIFASPTTEWPQNISTPLDDDIWLPLTDTFIENTILGQQHIWRIIFNYSGKLINDVTGIDVFLRNPISGFEAHNVVTCHEGVTADNNIQAILYTIADAASLPAPYGTGQGYELVFNSSKDIDIEIESLTRISTFHNKR